ncbi:hypothetical protein KI387_021323, partial [Taxus chinensis]
MDKILYAAVTSGNVEMYSKLIDNGLNILQQVTPTRNTSLHLAAYHGHLQIIEMFLQLMNKDIEAGNQGVRDLLTAKNVEGNTAFHEAAMGGPYQVMEFLLEHDPHLVDIINNSGETALFKATEEGHKIIVEKLLPLTSPQYDKRTSDGQTLLHCAVWNRHEVVIKMLMHRKPELLKEVDHFHRTALHNAAYLKDISPIARMLLEKDSSLCYQVDTNGKLALHIAVKEGNVELVKEILNYGKDCLEIVDNDGRNALHLAVDNAVQIFDRISRRIKVLMLLVLSTRLINNGKRPLDIVMDNMPNDERLFIGIKRLLQRNGGRTNPKTGAEEEITESSKTTDKTTWKIQIVSVNAVLIATVAFSAAYTLPTEGSHLHHALFFQTAVICMTVAFCTSIASAVLLMYALYGKQEDSLLLQTSIAGLWIALVALLLAFGAGVFLVVEPKHAKIATCVLVIVCTVPICIRIMIFRSKQYVFREDENHLWIFLIFVAVDIVLYSLSAPIAVGIVLVIAAVFTMAWITVFKYAMFSRIFGPKQHSSISRDTGISIW